MLFLMHVSNGFALISMATFLKLMTLPRGEGGSRVPRKRETDEGHLPLPLGEVPEAERAIFTLSVTS